MKMLKIYTLEENGTFVYIGKTERALNTRLTEHKRNDFAGRDIAIELLDTIENNAANGWQEYAYIDQFIGWGFPLENKVRDGEFHGTAGRRIPKEQRKKNHAEANRLWHLKNKKRQNEKNNNWKKTNRERNSQYSKEYKLNNKEAAKAYNKKKYQENKIEYSKKSLERYHLNKQL